MAPIDDMEAGGGPGLGYRRRGLRPSQFDAGAENAEHAASSSSFVPCALLCIVPGLYAVWYGLTLAMMAAFGNFSSVTYLEPFDHISFTPVVSAANWRPLVNWLSMLFSTTIAGPCLIYYALREPSRAIDCSIAIGTLHFFLSTTVTQQMPENWIWWATFMPAILFMGISAEFMLARFARQARSRRRRAAMEYGEQHSF